MELFRVHAFTVEPQRMEDEQVQPPGAGQTLTSELRQALDLNMRVARFDRRTPIDFRLNPETRGNPIRTLVMGYGFGDETEADQAASKLAFHLSTAMDRRTEPRLLIVAAMRADDERQVTLWIFPRDRAFRLLEENGRPSITVLTDVFSQTSELRKAARFQGKKLRTHFMSGRAIDFESSGPSRAVADFWVRRFLHCQFSLTGDAGTHLLAQTIRDAYDRCKDPEDRRQFYGLVMILGQSRRTRWSLNDLADNHLTGNAHKEFLRAVPNPDSLVSQFDVDAGTLQQALKIRIFVLDSGVHVSSPLGEVGKSVKLDGDDRPQLVCTGTVVSERLRTRHG
jgi:hypothetical protein